MSFLSHWWDMYGYVGSLEGVFRYYLWLPASIYRCRVNLNYKFFATYVTLSQNLQPCSTAQQGAVMDQVKDWQLKWAVRVPGTKQVTSIIKPGPYHQPCYCTIPLKSNGCRLLPVHHVKYVYKGFLQKLGKTQSFYIPCSRNWNIIPVWPPIVHIVLDIGHVLRHLDCLLLRCLEENTYSK